MRNIKFYVCPYCGTIITASGSPTVSCCGHRLEPLTPQKPDEAHRLVIETVENDWYLSAPHPMEKGHFLSLAALVTGEQVILIRRWPEWDFQVRFPKRGHGILYWYCTNHGLFRQTV